jgi:putative endonuclease
MRPQQDPDERNRRGREAEGLAAGHLASLGWKVVGRNHRARRGEVDLICREGREVHFVEVRSRTGEAQGVEVRSRTGEAQGGPEETVGPHKARRVVAAATEWALRNGGLEQPFRFDVVAVTFGEGDPRIVLYRDAFDADGRPGHW